MSIFLSGLVTIGFRRILLRLAAPISLLVAFAVMALLPSLAAANVRTIGEATIATPAMASSLHSSPFSEEDADLCVLCKRPHCSGHKVVVATPRVEPVAIAIIEDPAPPVRVVVATPPRAPPRYVVYPRPAFDPRGPPALG